jgi:hypothetical protein
MFRLLIFQFILSIHVYSQVNVISPETMYNGNGGINGESINTWETNNRFENDELIMSGSGDMRNTFPSDYTGSSGSWNVMLNNPGEYFQISSIDASMYFNITLSLGVRKSTLAENGSGLIVEASADGINWNILTVSLPTGTGTAGWHFVTITGLIPSVNTLVLRFTSNNSVEFRLDDIHLTGILPCVTQVDSIFPVTGPAGTLTTLFGTGFIGANQVFFNGIPASYFQVISDSTIQASIPNGNSSGLVQIQTTCLSSDTVGFQVIDFSCEQNGSNLVLSELCDPVNDYQTDRFIEIFNPTSHAINLEGWSVKAIANYLECETWMLTGMIQPGETKTCGYSNPLHGGPHDFISSTWNGNVVGSCCNLWNGNRRDGAALYHEELKIDEALYENSSVPWFSDHSLIRSDSSCNPRPFNNSGVWEISGTVNYAGEYPSSPGYHSTDCQGIPPVVSITPLIEEACEGSEVILQAVAGSGAPPFGFEWKVLDNSGDWIDIPSGFPYQLISTATSCIMTISGISYSLDPMQYYCKVYNNGGGCWAASPVAIVNMKPVPLTSAILHF